MFETNPFHWAALQDLTENVKETLQSLAGKPFTGEEFEKLVTPGLIANSVTKRFHKGLIPEENKDNVLSGILMQMLDHNPKKRPKLSELLKHKWFTSESDLHVEVDLEAKTGSGTEED